MLKSAACALYELAKLDPDIVYLSADNGTDYDFLFAREFPDRYYNVGIAEGNMVGMAAGLAAVGKKPFAITAGPFLAYRAYEFLRNDICLQRRKAVFLATGSGLSVGMLGPTHHTTEDLAVLRTLPGLEVLCPSSASEAAEAVSYAHSADKAVYVRLEMNGPSGDGAMLGQGGPIAGNALLRRGGDVMVVAVGSIVVEASAAVELLAERGLEASLLAVRRVSPLSANEVVEAAAAGMPVAVVEEHSVHGGLADSLALALASARVSADLLRIGVEEGFALGYGTQQEMRFQNGLDARSIAERILSFAAGGGR